MSASTRVLIIDDSAASRGYLAQILQARGYDIVGRAMDGAIALRMAVELKPHVVTCDLEMPRMDGFTFIRLLQSRCPTPVLVVTNNTSHNAALQALELGASDFIVKPVGEDETNLEFEERLAEKIRSLTNRHQSDEWDMGNVDIALPLHRKLVAIGASTGGPRALRDIFQSINKPITCPILIAQHMPGGFTRAFAARMRAATGLNCTEAVDGERLSSDAVRIAPGGAQLELEVRDEGYFTKVRPADPNERYAPSVDALFTSVAIGLGSAGMGVVLTGMGVDGAEGALKLAEKGAPIWAESALTALIDGMPGATADRVPQTVRLPIDRMAALLARVVCL